MWSVRLTITGDVQCIWCRHQMETFSALLAFCAGSSPVTGEFPAQGQWSGAVMFSLICAWINSWVNNRKADDLRRPRAHYDVSVMTPRNYHAHCFSFVAFYCGFYPYLLRLLHWHWGYHTIASLPATQSCITCEYGFKKSTNPVSLPQSNNQNKAFGIFYGPYYNCSSSYSFTYLTMLPLLHKKGDEKHLQYVKLPKLVRPKICNGKRKNPWGPMAHVKIYMPRIGNQWFRFVACSALSH